MHRLLFLIFVCAISLLAQNPPATVRLSGVAINAATDRPLASVQVRIGNTQRLTNSEGRFVFDNAPSGRQTLVANKDNFMVGGLDKTERPRTGIELTLRPGETPNELTLYLVPAGSVTGQVLNSAGEPLQGATITPLRYSYDDNGELRLHELVDSRITASVADPTFALLLRGLVSTESGRVRSSRSDDLGRFRIYNLDPGKYGFLVRGPDSVYYPGVADAKDAWIIDITSGVESRLINVVVPQGKAPSNPNPPRTLDTGITVSGTASIPQVQLLVSSSDVMSGVVLAIVIDDNGRFSTRSLPEGLYRVQSVKGAPTGMCVRDVRQGDGRNVLRDGLKVQAPETTFRMTIDSSSAIIRGQAGPAATVALVPDDRTDTHRYRTATADQDSAFEIRCVEPGNYHLYAWPYLDGAAYLNAEFMKGFNDRGSPLRVEGAGIIGADARVLD
jgi:hypothetical protein